MTQSPRALLTTVSAMALLSACAVPREPAPARPVAIAPAATIALEQGVRRYEDGQYEIAALWLDEALALGLEPADGVRAHKLRAFIDCIAARTEACKAHFREVLKLDPTFELIRAEAGHPMWGPVFSEVRKAVPVGAVKR